MRHPRTTIYGALAAVGTALASVPGIPGWLHTTAIAVAACSIGLVGFFAADRSPTGRSGTHLGIALVALAILITAAGCTVSTFGLGVSSPAFGTVQLDIGGGTIGNARQMRHALTNLSGLSASATSTNADAAPVNQPRKDPTP